MRRFEAILRNEENVRRVKIAKRAIEQAQGHAQIAPSGATGMTVIVLLLPKRYTPEMFVPGAPFYPA